MSGDRWPNSYRVAPPQNKKEDNVDRSGSGHMTKKCSRDKYTDENGCVDKYDVW